MDSLLRGIKQMGTGLKFTVDKELCSTSAYAAHKGRYKEFKVTIFKYKGEHATKAAEGFPLLKNIGDPIVAKLCSSQKSGGTFYMVTERVFPLEKGEAQKYPQFMQFVRDRVKSYNRKMEKEHSVRIASVGSEEVENSEIYFTEAGKPVVAGTMPVFVTHAKSGKAGKGGKADEWEEWGSDEEAGPGSAASIEKLDRAVDTYATSLNTVNNTPSMQIHPLVQECRNGLPPRYSRYICSLVVGYIRSTTDSTEKKIQMAKTVLMLKLDLEPLVEIFSISEPAVRVFALKTLQTTKNTTKELIDLIFNEINGGLLCTDELVRAETMVALPPILYMLSVKNKNKVLSSLGALVKKGKDKERETSAALILKEHLEFLEVPETLYNCMGCMIQSSDVSVKRNGLQLANRLKDSLEMRPLVLELIPLVSHQSVFSEVADQAVELLCSLSERAKRDVELLKAADTWKVPGLGIITKTPPIKPDTKTVKKLKERKERKEKERNGWDDQEW
ncbi:hypothetical protein NEDG_01972 [Nematocida displodere]|uniref:Uncharacterized protein n=1 Tax=Nematocida displodere TaxID=1805483 RepID=A0A177EHJ4_9MICR|nr:hypothetical protein NEDG_01972 [Nematocida displodere]